MKNTVLTYGLIAGAILSLMLLITIPFADDIGFEKGEIVGYTTMVLAFLLVFFGVKSYRDSAAGGVVGFGRAFTVGLLIVAVASVCYVLTWQVVYFKLSPGFAEKYQAYAIDKARAEGQSEPAIAQLRADMERFVVVYNNPAINAAITFLEPLPVGLVVALVSAGVLRKRR